jgi:hypothetical protein
VIAGPVYFHGGYPRLYPGDLVLPPRVTGAPSLGAYMPEVARRQRIANPYRADRVFVVTSEAEARLYAGAYPGGGALYIVEPQGDLEPDPDCTEPGLSWMAPAARVVKCLRRGLRMTQAQLEQIAMWGHA